MEAVALVIPPMESYVNYWLPHLGFGYLSSILLKSGYRPVVVDAVAEHLSRAKLRGCLRRLRPLAIFLSATTAEVSDAHDVALCFKAEFPDRLVIVGGAHSSALLRETLERCPGFDIAVAGEGEHLAGQLVDAVRENRDLSTISGIAFRRDGKITVTGPSEHAKELDRLPFPHWDSFTRKGYRGIFQMLPGLEIPVMGSRGCPYECSFCQRVCGTTVRFRSVKSVVEEIEYALSKGATSVVFNDETFTLDRRWVVRFCELVMSRGLQQSIYWHCQTRADLVDAELLGLMKQAGCRVITYGAESFDDRVLRGVKKDLTAKQTIRAVELTKAAGMQVFLCLVFGLPNDTRSTIRSSISTLLSLPVDYVSISLLAPYPGTEIRQAAGSGIGGLRIRSEGWDDCQIQTGGALEIKGLNYSHLRHLQLYAYLRFYLRPSRVRNMMGLVALSGALKHARGALFGWTK